MSGLPKGSAGSVVGALIGSASAAFAAHRYFAVGDRLTAWLSTVLAVTTLILAAALFADWRLEKRAPRAVDHTDEAR